MKKNDWKERLNVVYSTNPDFNYDIEDDAIKEDSIRDIIIYEK